MDAGVEGMGWWMEERRTRADGWKGGGRELNNGVCWMDELKLL